MVPHAMATYGNLCGWTLARAHARSGDRIAIAAYLGNGDSFDRAIVEFSKAYADQNDRDYRDLAAAVKAGRITAKRASDRSVFRDLVGVGLLGLGRPRGSVVGPNVPLKGGRDAPRQRESSGCARRGIRFRAARVGSGAGRAMRRCFSLSSGSAMRTGSSSS